MLRKQQQQKWSQPLETHSEHTGSLQPMNMLFSNCSGYNGTEQRGLWLVPRVPPFQHLCNHMIAIPTFGNWFSLMTSWRALSLSDHICNLSYWLLQKISGETMGKIASYWGKSPSLMYLLSCTPTHISIPSLSVTNTPRHTLPGLCCASLASLLTPLHLSHTLPNLHPLCFPCNPLQLYIPSMNHAMPLTHLLTPTSTFCDPNHASYVTPNTFFHSPWLTSPS